MFFLEPNVKVPGRVIGKPGEEERVGFGDAARRASEAFPFLEGMALAALRSLPVSAPWEG
jgi:hypothetical protein